MNSPSFHKWIRAQWGDLWKRCLRTEVLMVAALSANQPATASNNSSETASYWRYSTERWTHWSCHTSQSAAERGSKQQRDGHRLGHHHDKTLRASVSILSSSFTPSRPPWIFSGLSSTSTLQVYGSNLTEKGRLIPATYPLVKDRERSEELIGEVALELFMNVCVTAAPSESSKPRYFTWPEEASL